MCDVHKHGVRETESGFYVVALDGGGRPVRTRWNFSSRERAELECLQMNKIKKMRDGTIDDKFMSSKSPDAMTWREWYEGRIAVLKALLIARKKAAHV